MSDRIYDIAAMVGRITTEVRQTEEKIDFTFADGATGHFYHEQDCCETVEVEDVNGDWSDLYGVPLLVADERVSDTEPGLSALDDSNTWTFYTFRTIKGSVDVRWHGSSNGYYSEGVDFYLEEPTTLQAAATEAEGRGDE